MEYDNVLSQSNLDLVAQMAEKTQELPIFETFSELKTENFGKWYQVKFEDEKSKL